MDFRDEDIEIKHEPLESDVEEQVSRIVFFPKSLIEMKGHYPNGV